MEIRGQPVCHALFCSTPTTQTGHRLANQLLADARHSRVCAGGLGGGWFHHTHQSWDRCSGELGRERMTLLDFVLTTVRHRIDSRVIKLRAAARLKLRGVTLNHWIYWKVFNTEGFFVSFTLFAQMKLCLLWLLTTVRNQNGHLLQTLINTVWCFFTRPEWDDMRRDAKGERSKNVQCPTSRLRGATVEALNRMDPDLIETP